MKWEYEVDMDESYANITEAGEVVDEWGCAYVTLEEKHIGAEYNFCIDDTTNEMDNCCAIYWMYEDDEENWHTDCGDYQHYEIDFSDKEWKEKLIEAMKQFVIEHLKEENK